MQAIELEYKGPTNHKPSRFIARCDAGRLVMSPDTPHTPNEQTMDVVQAFCRKIGWGGSWAIGATRKGWCAVAMPGSKNSDPLVVLYDWRLLSDIDDNRRKD